MNTWNRDTVEKYFNVSRETLDKFDIYVDLLQKWQSKVNLIGPSTTEDIWGRHIADSLQLLKFIPLDIKNYPFDVLGMFDLVDPEELGEIPCRFSDIDSVRRELENAQKLNLADMPPRYIIGIGELLRVPN